jgi:hypothetical protein
MSACGMFQWMPIGHFTFHPSSTSGSRGSTPNRCGGKRFAFICVHTKPAILLGDNPRTFAMLHHQEWVVELEKPVSLSSNMNPKSQDVVVLFILACKNRTQLLMFQISSCRVSNSPAKPHPAFKEDFPFKSNPILF